jgi:hypothetical protein
MCDIDSGGECDPVKNQGVGPESRIRGVQSDSGRTWAVGAIANGYLLAQDGRWVSLNVRAHRAGSWQPGDVVNDHAFTGAD